MYKIWFHDIKKKDYIMKKLNRLLTIITDLGFRQLREIKLLVTTVPWDNLEK